ncbi:MAG: 50S ribosomal protein L3 [Candidatus Eisenbacteria bacterium]|nr:50S ribosomal protein L3 [Candidatus Eisenbacteria bacterium]
MSGIIGRKLGMTRVFTEDGSAVPVTVVEAGPCVVTGVRTEDRHGYGAVQLGYEKARRKTLTKPVAGQYDAVGLAPRKVLREFRVADPESYEIGQQVTVDIFEPGEMVQVTGWSKGRGFQGNVRRHNKSVGRRTHGNKSRRAPGSIGQSASPAKVWKGRKLPGRMGGERVRLRSLPVVEVDADKGLLLIRGALPGAANGLVMIRKTGGAGK